MGDAAFHGIVGDIVRTIEPHSEADPAALVLLLLAEFGAQVGPRPHAFAGAAEHPARLNVVIVGATSKGRKGTAGREIERVTDAVDPGFARDRRLYGFGSGEALIDAVRGADGNTDNRLLVVEPEFARVLNVCRRDGSTLSQVIRQAWDGGRLSVRSRAGVAVAEDSHVVVVGHISLEELRAKLAESELASGFANRFLYCCARRSKLLPFGGGAPECDLKAFSASLASLAGHARTVHRLERTPEADALWGHLYTEMAEDEPGGMLGQVIARDAAQVLRTSVAYALLDGVDEIGVDHVRAAWAIWQYCRASAAFIWADSLGDPVADRLLRAIRDAGELGLDATSQGALFAGHASRRQLDEARKLLLSRGLITIEAVETGGRPSMVARSTACEKCEISELSPRLAGVAPRVLSVPITEPSPWDDLAAPPPDDAPPLDEDELARREPTDEDLARWLADYRETPEEIQ